MNALLREALNSKEMVFNLSELMAAKTRLRHIAAHQAPTWCVDWYADELAFLDRHINRMAASSERSITIDHIPVLVDP